MNVSKEPRAHQLQLLDTGKLGQVSILPTGHLCHASLVLLFLSFMVLAGLLVTILIVGLAFWLWKEPEVASSRKAVGLKVAVGSLGASKGLSSVGKELTQLKPAMGEGPERSRQEETYKELAQLKAAVDAFPQLSRQEIYKELTQLKAAVGTFPQRSRQEEMYKELTQLKTGIRECPAQSRQEEIYQQVTQLNAAVGECPDTRSPMAGEFPCAVTLLGSHCHLCCRCPWDWTFFQGNCYFFSTIQRNRHNSMTACQEVGAQLVMIKSTEEQDFLRLQVSTKERHTWIGLSDLTHEGTWQWVDGSPLPSSFTKYWNNGEPNNIGEEDCVEFKGKGWNDHKCNVLNFWICKKSAASCPRQDSFSPSPNTNKPPGI
uniref:C-type lectin domain-containing protein n=1 Tax=Otolemur garnettii TaxID=30611 RepID=H0WZM7_OTOGA